MMSPDEENQVPDLDVSVASFEPRLGRRPSRNDLGDQDPFLDRKTERFGGGGQKSLEFQSGVGVPHVTMRDQLGDDLPGRRDGNGEPDPGRCAGRGKMAVLIPTMRPSESRRGPPSCRD